MTPSAAGPTEASPPRVDPSDHEAPAQIDIMGIRFDETTEAECVDLIVRRGLAGQGGWMITPNPFAFRLWAVSAWRGVTGWKRKLKADNS